MKLLSSFRLATRFYSNGASIFFVSFVRWHELGLWLIKIQYEKNDNNNENSVGVRVVLVVGIVTFDRKMTSFPQSENIIAL